MSSYVTAHLDTRSVVSLVKITNALLKYASENLDEVTNEGTRKQDWSLSASLVEWYLRSFGIRAELENDIHNLRYVFPAQWLHREIGSTGDIVVADGFKAVYLLGYNGALCYDETTRTSLLYPNRIPTRFDFKLQTYHIHPQQPAVLPEEIYEQCKESYTLRSNKAS